MKRNINGIEPASTSKNDLAEKDLAEKDLRFLNLSMKHRFQIEHICTEPPQTGGGGGGGGSKTVKDPTPTQCMPKTYKINNKI